LKINLRKDRMTRNERWKALLNKKPTDRVPVWGWAMGFPVVQTKLSIADFYNNAQKSYDAQMKIADEFGFQEIPWTGYATIGGWEFGGDIKWPSGDFAQAPTVERHPVESPDDVWNLKVPDVKTAGIAPVLMELADLVDKSGSPYIIGFVQGPFTTASNIPGADKLAKWILKKPDVAHQLLRLATDYQAELAKYFVERYGAERVIPLQAEPATSNQMISPKQFEEFALPYIKELCDRMLALGIKHIKMHICGEQNANLEHWAKINFGDPGLLSFGHEVTMETASKYFPNDIIMGNTDPALLQNGTPEEVYEDTKICLAQGMKHTTGYMLTPGCELPPMAPAENVWAMMQAVSDFGWHE